MMPRLARWVRALRDPQQVHVEEVLPPGPNLLTHRAARRFGAAVDRSVLTLMKRPSQYPDERQRMRVAYEVERAHRLYDGRGLLAEPGAFHEAPPPLTNPRTVRKRFRGFDVDHLIFPSAFRPEPGDPTAARWLARERNRTAHAWVIRHPEPDRPWLVCLHGLGMGHPRLDFGAFDVPKLVNKQGFNVLLPVLPLHGARRDRGVRLGALLSYELVENLHGLRQSVWDVRRLMGWARTQGAGPMGAYGVSIGSLVAALLAATEPLDLVLAGIPVCDVPTLFHAHAPPALRKTLEDDAFLGDPVRELYSMVSPGTLGTRTPGDRRFLYGGLADHLSTPQQAVALWEAWDRPGLHWYHGGHVGFFWSASVRRYVVNALANLHLSPGASR